MLSGILKMTDTTRELIQLLADALTNAIRVIHNEDGTQHVSTATPVLDEARAYLAQPEPEGPSESDVTELFYRHVGDGSEVGFENAIEEALARWGRPATVEPPAKPAHNTAQDSSRRP